MHETLAKKQILAIIETHLKEKFGEQFTPEIFELAKTKARTWQRNAYGSVDWEEHYNEAGLECIDFWFEECLDRPNDQNSFNREVARGRR